MVNIIDTNGINKTVCNVARQAERYIIFSCLRFVGGSWKNLKLFGYIQRATLTTKKWWIFIELFLLPLSIVDICILSNNLRSEWSGQSLKVNCSRTERCPCQIKFCQRVFASIKLARWKFSFCSWKLRTSHDLKNFSFIQTSASECVLVTMLAARAQAIKNLKQQHPFVEEGHLLSKLMAYCSKEAHSCVEKAAMICFVKLR